MVGAGMAGLCAADVLSRAGVDVVVLEARDRVGGRVFNERLSTGEPIDIGGQWLGPTQTRAVALAARLGLQTFPTHTEGRYLLERRDGSVVRYRGTIPRISPVTLADVGQAQVRLDLMARRVPLAAPWKAKRAARWDSMSFATWLDRNLATGQGRDLLDIAVAAVWACEPEDLSLLHVLFYIHSGGRFDDLIGTAGGAQQDRVVGGTQQMAEGLAALLGDRVRLGRAVERIVQDERTATVYAGGEEVTAERAIVAMAPALAARIHHEPALPALRAQLTQRVPMGSVIKCLAVYDEPFWRGDGLNGQAISVEGPARAVFDNSLAGGSPGMLVAFLEGRHARTMSSWPLTERRDAVLAGLARLFGPRAAAPQEYLEKDWALDPWSAGCYTGLFGPGTWTGFGPALRAPAGRLHWAGTETAEVWSGYIDGAVRSGEAAAAHVLALRGAGASAV